jgi:hypothetical protein
MPLLAHAFGTSRAPLNSNSAMYFPAHVIFRHSSGQRLLGAVATANRSVPLKCSTIWRTGIGNVNFSKLRSSWMVYHLTRTQSSVGVSDPVCKKLPTRFSWLPSWKQIGNQPGNQPGAEKGVK